MTTMVYPKVVVKSPKKLRVILKKHSGRSSRGQVTVRGQAGRHKRYYRQIDFRRDKYGVEGVIQTIEYDPNRNTEISLVKYTDGEYRYILSPKDLKVGDKIISDEKADVHVGNAMRLKNIPVGSFVHSVELTPGRGGQLARSAGTSLQLLAKESGFASLKMPSGEVRVIALNCFASIGVLGNEDWKNLVIGKAGRSRHMGKQPKVRGVAMDPASHAHGGGEGRTGVGRKKPMTYYGKPAVGKTRKKTKWTNKYIIKRRK